MHVQNQLFEHRADLRATYLHTFGRTVFEKEVGVEGLIVSARSASHWRAVAWRDRTRVVNVSVVPAVLDKGHQRDS